MADKVDRRIQQPPPSNDLLERLARFNLHFGRFIRDGLGIFLIAAACISLLGLLSFTGGMVLTPWSDFLGSWFGWGSFLLLAGVVLGGFALIRRAGSPLKWGRLLAIELAVLLSLGLLSIIGGNSLARAEVHLDGGRLGWGLAYLAERLLGLTGGTALLAVLWLLCLLTGIGAWSRLEIVAAGPRRGYNSTGGHA